MGRFLVILLFQIISCWLLQSCVYSERNVSNYEFVTGYIGQDGSFVSQILLKTRSLAKQELISEHGPTFSNFEYQYFLVLYTFTKENKLKTSPYTLTDKLKNKLSYSELMFLIRNFKNNYKNDSTMSIIINKLKGDTVYRQFDEAEKVFSQVFFYNTASDSILNIGRSVPLFGTETSIFFNRLENDKIDDTLYLKKISKSCVNQIKTIGFKDKEYLNIAFNGNTSYLVFMNRKRDSLFAYEYDDDQMYLSIKPEFKINIRALPEKGRDYFHWLSYNIHQYRIVFNNGKMEFLYLQKYKMPSLNPFIEEVFVCESGGCSVYHSNAKDIKFQLAEIEEN